MPQCPHCYRNASTHRNYQNKVMHGGIVKKLRASQHQYFSSIVLRSNNRKIEMRLFIMYNLQLEIINFLYKNLRKALRVMRNALAVVQSSTGRHEN